MFRHILRLLANNEKLVHALSESYVIRRAAQLTVAAFYRGKSFVIEKDLHKTLTPERFRSLMNSFRENLKKEIDAAKKELEHKKMK